MLVSFFLTLLAKPASLAVGILLGKRVSVQNAVQIVHTPPWHNGLTPPLLRSYSHAC